MKESIYDFTENRFRRMEPDDYITLSTKVSYVQLDYDSGAVNDVSRAIPFSS